MNAIAYLSKKNNPLFYQTLKEKGYPIEFFSDFTVIDCIRNYVLIILDVDLIDFTIVKQLNNRAIQNIFIITTSVTDVNQDAIYMEALNYNLLDIAIAPLPIEALEVKLKGFFQSTDSIYKNFLDSMETMSVITNQKKEIIYANNAFLEETGYDQSIIGQAPNIIKSGRHSVMFYNNLDHTLKSGLSWHGTFKNKRKDGSHYQEDAYIFPFDYNGDTFYGKTAINSTVQDMIATENKQAIQLATSVQQSLLPEDIYADPLIIRSKYLPLENVSGDIFNTYIIDDDTYCVFLADVVGHGIGSALLSTTIIAVANEIIMNNYMPDTFLKELNTKIMDLFHANELPQTTYFTAAYLVIDTKNQQIHYANCGHPEIYLFTRDTLEKLMKPNFFIGMFQGANFEYLSHHYQGKCKLLVYTDGLSELKATPFTPKADFKNCINCYKTDKDGDLIQYLMQRVVQPNTDRVTDDISMISIELIKE